MVDTYNGGDREMKYKVGQRVRIIGNHYSSGEPSSFQGMVGQDGEVVSVDQDSKYPYVVRAGDYKCCRLVESDLEPVEDHPATDTNVATKKTLDNLEVGDVVMNPNGRMTVEDLVQGYVMRYDDGTCGYFNYPELVNGGYVVAEPRTITIKNKTYREADVLKALEGLEEIE